MNFRKIGTITVKKLRVAALTGGLVVAASTVAVRAHAQLPPTSYGAPQAQATTAEPQSAQKKIYARASEFKLPIVMDPTMRSRLAQVRLYAKSPGGDWAQQEVAGPTATSFIYRVPQDGEYWFTLVTVDNQGRQTPANINSEPPGLRVVVDTRAPVIETNIMNEFGETVLSVNVIDANPDPASVRVRALGSAGERYLTPMPGHPNKFRVTAADLAMPIRVTASDLSGNASTKDLPASGGGALQVAGGLPPMIPSAPMSIAPPPGQYNPPTMPTPPLQQPIPQSIAMRQPTPYQNPPVTMPTPQPGGIANTAYRQSFETDRPNDRKLINTTHAQIEFRVDKVGPSGLGKVEVFMTRDRGNSWEKLADSPNKRSPVDVDLPGEGVFGLRMVLSNGNGIGGHPPRSGERPQYYIEVDATSPTVQILPYEMVPGANALDIRWTATDANLGAEPVSIYYRTRADAGWQPMVRNLKNDGVYRWAFPRDVGGQIFYKLEVVDMAGNMTKVETPTPILLDQTEPEATLLDIVGVGGNRPAPAAGLGTVPPITDRYPIMPPPR
ncbi:MAG TPA: hypothetical protein VHR72_02910 [Gemmataceae bacterium]|jgi:hypothetical protein|nr:hypothetical protein [Gemmataceae bacterium]